MDALNRRRANEEPVLNLVKSRPKFVTMELKLWDDEVCFFKQELILIIFSNGISPKKFVPSFLASFLSIYPYFHDDQGDQEKYLSRHKS